MKWSRFVFEVALLSLPSTFAWFRQNQIFGRISHDRRSNSVLSLAPENHAPTPMSNDEDHLISAISGNSEVIVKCITARNLVQDAVIRQGLRPLAADALGRVMICTLLCASSLKDQETLQFTFAGDGPLNGIVAISDGEGGVRGFVGNGMIDMGKANDVGIGIGQGLLKVVRNHPDYERPYSGIVALRNSQVSYDVAGYLRDSQQSESIAVASGVIVSEALVRQAGGYIVETLPGASQETINRCAENVGKLMTLSENPSDLLADGMTPAAIAEALLEGVGGMNSLSMIKPIYKCHCTSERLYRALRLLGNDEVQEIIAKNDHVEAKCDFCGMVYRLSASEIAAELEF